MFTSIHDIGAIKMNICLQEIDVAEWMIKKKKRSRETPKKERLKPLQSHNVSVDKVKNIGGAHGEMVMVVGNGHGDTSSNPRPG